MTVRSLEHLENTASTARVLNLRMLAVKRRKDPEYIAKPLFQTPALNKSIIVKHRLRANEQDEFSGSRRTATKILLPIETGDLRSGARYLFVGQRNFNELLWNSFGVRLLEGDADSRTLAIIDRIPSLDPFLLREQLKRHGIEAAPCYFELSEPDMDRMLGFAQREIQQLVSMSFGDDPKFASHATRLAQKILMNSGDSELEPLRLTMQLSQQQYQEGVFCWKAFLYYKWRLTSVLHQLGGVMQQIAKVTPNGPVDKETMTYLTGAKTNLRRSMVAACQKVKQTIAIYDNAYEGLTKRGQPVAFRDFLLKAPALFDELGERLGGVDHIVSFWQFRFPGGRKPVISAEDLSDIFMDFEGSLNFGEARAEAA